MAQVGFVGIEKALAKLEKHKLLVKGKITQTKRAVVQAVLVDLVTNSPQWSGNLASQWYLEVGTARGSYRPIPGYGDTDLAALRSGAFSPYQMGDDPAVGQTLSRELSKLDSIKWNSKVQITNYAPYASEVEDGIGPVNTNGIREENKLASYGAVAMKGYVTMKYNNLRYLKKLL